MNFLIITQYYPPEVGAAATRWSEYSDIIISRGHSLTILCELPNYPSGKISEGYPKYWFYEEPQTSERLRIIRVPVWANARKTTIQRLGFFTSFMMTACLRSAFLPRYDYIIVSSPPLFVGLVASFLRIFKRAKYILDLRDIWPESAHVLGEIRSNIMLSFGRLLERIVYRSADLFFLAVPGFSEYLNQKHPAHRHKKKFELMNGVSESFSKMIVEQLDEVTQNKKFTVLFSGNIGLAQGLETILDAAEILINNDVEFIIIGDGAKRDELISLATANKISNVKFLSSMPRDSLVRHILGAHVCLVPLIKSPLFLNAIPSKMLEYMAASKPVIVGIQGEVENILTRSNGGVSIEPESATELSATILEYKNDPNRVKREGEAGRKFIEDGMTKEVMIDKVLDDLT